MEKSNEREDRLLTFAEACRGLPNRPSPSTFWRWRTHGIHGVKLACVRVGGRWAVTRQAVDEFLDAVTKACTSDADIVGASHEAPGSKEALPRPKGQKMNALQRVLVQFLDGPKILALQKPQDWSVKRRKTLRYKSDVPALNGQSYRIVYVSSRTLVEITARSCLESVDGGPLHRLTGEGEQEVAQFAATTSQRPITLL